MLRLPRCDATSGGRRDGSMDCQKAGFGRGLARMYRVGSGCSLMGGVKLLK